VTDTGYPCIAPGCTLPGNATETLWLEAPLGLTVVHVHQERACAKAAREKRGGGRFLPGEPMPPEERAARERYAARVGKREPFGGAS
jgi:hypothetical protein